MRNFKQNTEGFLIEGLIAIVFIVCSSLIWLIGALIVNQVFDFIIPFFPMDDPRALLSAQTAVNTYGVVIVFVDVLLLVWWGLSAQRVESEETASGGVIYE